MYKYILDTVHSYMPANGVDTLGVWLEAIDPPRRADQMPGMKCDHADIRSNVDKQIALSQQEIQGSLNSQLVVAPQEICAALSPVGAIQLHKETVALSSYDNFRKHPPFGTHWLSTPQCGPESHQLQEAAPSRKLGSGVGQDEKR